MCRRWGYFLILFFNSEASVLFFRYIYEPVWTVLPQENLFQKEKQQ